MVETLWQMWHLSCLLRFYSLFFFTPKLFCLGVFNFSFHTQTHLLGCISISNFFFVTFSFESQFFSFSKIFNDLMKSRSLWKYLFTYFLQYAELLVFLFKTFSNFLQYAEIQEFFFYLFIKLPRVFFWFCQLGSSDSTFLMLSLFVFSTVVYMYF